MLFFFYSAPLSSLTRNNNNISSLLTLQQQHKVNENERFRTIPNRRRFSDDESGVLRRATFSSFDQRVSVGDEAVVRCVLLDYEGLVLNKLVQMLAFYVQKMQAFCLVMGS
ncbi:uncharacterized protein LOC131623460 [Vicia villosa]|uniref:uncharacterized protein LOC131623460 n=1 Tax=Vicia villosa TaxID=3911 RepID=UPI00273B3EDA|nr:uncharacterized protein LOC131623460 [Vicia villosa]